MPRAAISLFSWIKKGSWSVVDQGLFAGGNFILNILLARWLEPAEYGAFTIAFTVFLLLGIFHTALLTEPMLVFGQRQYRGRISSYLATLLRGHALFAVLGALVLAAAGAAFARWDAVELSADFYTLAVAQAFILFIWLMRRACYAVLQPSIAAGSGLVYVLLIVPGAVLLNATTHLSSITALILMSGASLGAGIVLLFALRIRLHADFDRRETMDTIRRHWSYGRWAAATGLLTWISAQLVMLLVPIWSGIEGTAAFKALMNLTMPAVHAYVAFTVLMVPAFVRAQAHGTLRKTLGASVLLVSLSMIGYWIALGQFGDVLIQWLYDGAYADYTHLLWLVGALPLMAGLVAIMGAVLRAIERPDRLFWAYAASSVVILTAGLLFLNLYGVMGAVLCQLSAMVVAALFMTIFVWRHALHTDGPEAPIRPVRADTALTEDAPSSDPDTIPRTNGPPPSGSPALPSASSRR